jgi:hypothetical protein
MTRRSLAEKGWVPIWRWAVWWFVLVLADIVFYVLLTPLWLGIRAVACGRRSGTLPA